MNCAEDRPGRLDYNHAAFARAKAFVMRKWRECAGEFGLDPPTDLSGACRYSSLFVRELFGGSLQGHYEHQYNRIDGRIVDLSHDAADVGHMRNPYLHEPCFFDTPEHQDALERCMPRVRCWVDEFVRDLKADKGL